MIVSLSPYSGPVRCFSLPLLGFLIPAFGALLGAAFPFVLPWAACLSLLPATCKTPGEITRAMPSAISLLPRAVGRVAPCSPPATPPAAPPTLAAALAIALAAAPPTLAAALPTLFLSLGIVISCSLDGLG